MKTLDRRSLGLGALLGAGAVVLLAIGMGVGRSMSAGEPVVTFGGDGSHAFLWRVSGDQLVFVSSAHADYGGDDEHGRGKPDDKDDKREKGDKGEKGGGKGRGKGGG